MPLIDERVFATFEDGSFLSFAQGKKDRWCVYYTTINPDMPPKPLLDSQYFQYLRIFANQYGRDLVYRDFVSIYDKTTDIPDDAMVEDIQHIAEHYPNDRLRVAKVFTTLYMAMVAEFYYVTSAGQPSRLTKRVKRLGVHQSLFCPEMTVQEIANFSKRKCFIELNTICQQYGF